MDSDDFDFSGGPMAGGPDKRQRTAASTFEQSGSLIGSFEHLSSLPDPSYALNRLRKIASLVKPIMRKRGWKVKVLTEFMPPQQRLLGLNVNHGYKICLRLRYTHNPSSFLPIEETIDTMLHELCHIVHGPHDGPFHRLWEELRDENETLLMKGFTGENFLSKGHVLGGSGPMPRNDEMRRMARQSVLVNGPTGGSGRRLGGEAIPFGHDHRRAIADSVERRLTQHNGCASDQSDAEAIADQATKGTFTTMSTGDDANDRAIAEALYELMIEEENELARKRLVTHKPSAGLIWSPERGLENQKDDAILRVDTAIKSPSVRSPDSGKPAKRQKVDDSAVAMASAISAANPPTSTPRPSTVPALSPSDAPWPCEICTFINPPRYLTCDACGMERIAPLRPNQKSAAASLQKIEREATVLQLQKPETLGWNCKNCRAWMEHCWWTCSACGTMKGESKANEHVL